MRKEYTLLIIALLGGAMLMTGRALDLGFIVIANNIVWYDNLIQIAGGIIFFLSMLILVIVFDAPKKENKKNSSNSRQAYIDEDLINLDVPPTIKDIIELINQIPLSLWSPGILFPGFEIDISSLNIMLYRSIETPDKISKYSLFFNDIEIKGDFIEPLYKKIRSFKDNKSKLSKERRDELDNILRGFIESINKSNEHKS